MSHSHLPPRPEFEHSTSSRYPPPDRYGRPMAPPSDRYRDTRDPYPPRSPPRDRGDVYVPRSPPRSIPRSSAPYPRASPRDSYPLRDPLPPRDAYPPRDLPPRDSYYDRREDSRYYRDWQRRDGPEYRSRPPPPPPRDYGREPPSDFRSRDIDRGRRWDDERRRSYDWDRRERSPVRDRGYPRSRDSERPVPRERPLEPERRWVPRASKSPPRRMAPSASSGPRSSSMNRGRSPSPPRFRESPTRSNYGRPSSPPRSPPRDSSRYTSPGVLKLGSHSIDVSPRYTPRRERGRPRSPDSRPHSPGRYRSGSRSPVKRSTPAASQPNVDRSRPDEMTRDDFASSIPTESRPSDTHYSPTSVKQEKLDAPVPPTVVSSSAEYRRVPDLKAVPEISRPVQSPSLQSHPPSANYSQPRRRSRSPPTQPRHFVKTPTTPSSPQVPTPTQNLPVKPDWSSNKASPLSTSTPTVETVPSHSAPSAHVPWIPRYRTSNVSHELEAEIARVETQRGRLSTEYVAMAKETRRAMHELELTSRDLKLAEQRRSIAIAQLEKARAGLLGVEYSA
ncbi:hypothetical protein QCA50_002887 [Cerrena zonata]|uniref:Uncharacterized protein n=1 Tax=Cerrena zonata TaxID=2478898 RepID=A0AAW0GQL5_9APHY